MSDGRITFTIPDVPPSWNVYDRKHWAAKARLKNEWQTRVRLECFKAQLPKDCERIAAVVTFRFPTARRRDLGNFQSTTEKFLGDALQPDFLGDDTHDRFSVLASITDEKGPKQTTISLDYTLAREEAA